MKERQTGDSVEIDVHYPHHDFVNHVRPFGGRWSGRVAIIIQIPSAGRVSLHTGDGKIDVAGLKGDMDLHTGDGSINLDGVDWKLHATTGDGHIQAKGALMNSD